MERDADGRWLPCKLCGAARPHSHKWGVAAADFWSEARVEAEEAGHSRERDEDAADELDDVDRYETTGPHVENEPHMSESGYETDEWEPYVEQDDEGQRYFRS